MRPIVVLSVIVFTILACGEDEVIDKPPVVAEPVNVNLIVPGESAAGIKLGDEYSDVVELHGKSHEDFYEEDFSASKHNWNSGITVYVDDSNRVYRIEIRDPNKAMTAGGNKIGSKRDNVKVEFPRRADEAGQGGRREGLVVFTERWKIEGIHFEYWLASWTVSQIAVIPKDELTRSFGQ